MAADPRLAKLPALLKLAEEWAMRHYALLRYRLASPTQSGGPPWNDLDARYREAAIEAAMDWLGDLRYPEAWDAVVRLIDIYGDASDRDLAHHARGDVQALTLIALRVLGSHDAHQ